MDILAIKAAEIFGFNRKMVNRYYTIYREKIAAYRDEQNKRIVGAVELDESSFGAARPGGVVGPRKRGRGTSKQPVFRIFKPKWSI